MYSFFFSVRLEAGTPGRWLASSYKRPNTNYIFKPRDASKTPHIGIKYKNKNKSKESNKNKLKIKKNI